MADFILCYYDSVDDPEASPALINLDHVTTIDRNDNGDAVISVVGRSERFVTARSFRDLLSSLTGNLWGSADLSEYDGWRRRKAEEG
jgi:hypothetical protein